MRINEDILRYMTIAVSKHEEPVSDDAEARPATIAPRRDGDRPDRGGLATVSASGPWRPR